MVVIGGGVVGLATAAALAGPDRSVVLLERHEGFGRETTSRNSEVIHAGLYYPRDSLKARFCVEGRERLYARCAREPIPHRRLGKFVIACDRHEIGVLETLRDNGLDNGAGALEMVEGATLRRSEPALRAHAALWSPESGIVDALALCRSLAAEAEAKGALLALRHTFVAIDTTTSDLRLLVDDPGGERLVLRASRVVNAAGLVADAIAESAGVDLDANALRHHYCKGDYFALAPGVSFSLDHLVYPVPVAAGLGIHATLDMGGQIRFGPDTEYVGAVEYRVDGSKADAFARAIARYLPALRSEDLRADYAGIRPKRAGPGESSRDFAVVESAACPAWVHLIGIESPGLTAALALAEEVARRLR